MRYFCYILSLYFSALAFLPCADIAHAALHQAQEIAEELHVPTEGNTASHMDFCSPLCYCSCCGVTSPTVSFLKPSLNLPENVLATLTINRAQVFSQSYSASVFRPPIFG